MGIDNLPSIPILGGQVNIIPTLVELAAPRGFEYKTMGRNLLDANSPQLSIGYKRVITPDYLATAGQDEVRFYNLPNVEIDAMETPADAAEVKRQHDYRAGISWWRIMRGNKLD